MLDSIKKNKTAWRWPDGWWSLWSCCSLTAMPFRLYCNISVDGSSTWGSPPLGGADDKSWGTSHFHPRQDGSLEELPSVVPNQVDVISQRSGFANPAKQFTFDILAQKKTEECCILHHGGNLPLFSPDLLQIPPVETSGWSRWTGISPSARRIPLKPPSSVPCNQNRAQNAIWKLFTIFQNQSKKKTYLEDFPVWGRLLYLLAAANRIPFSSHPSAAAFQTRRRGA